MTATRNDALSLLQKQTPDHLWNFVQVVCADPQMDIHAAAEVVGRPGKGAAMMRDPRTARVFLAMLSDTQEAARDHRLKAVQLLSALCGYDPAAAFDEYGVPLSIHDMPPDVRAALVSYERKLDGTVKLRFQPRIDALRLLFQHFGDVESRAFAAAGTATVIFHGRGDADA